MCGIFGFYLKEKIINSDYKTNAIQALNYLNHRGPDNSNYWINEKKNFFLGHTRLTIIDKSQKSNQPFFKKEIALSYNGEIYNYKNLRESLKKDFNFNTSGDTEVLFNFLIKNNVQNLDVLDGMFAFAFYNSEELYICTDIFGEKPIYYIQNNEGFFFSSEIEPLKHFLRISKDPSIDKKNKFLMFGYLREETFYKNLNYCRPSSIIKVAKGLIVYKKQYWSYADLLKEKNKKKVIDDKDISDIKNLLINSCEARLNSDYPISLLLSSGVDSSLLASLYKMEINANIESFHASFTDLENTNSTTNETKITKKIANHLGLKVLIENIDLDQTLFTNKNLLKIFKEPNDNISALLTYRMSEVIRQKYKVAISGLGADEIFYGYNGYNFFVKNLKYINSNLISLLTNWFPNIKNKKLETLKYYKKFKNLDLIFSQLNYDYFTEIESKNYDDLKYEFDLSFVENYSLIRFSSRLPYQMLLASDRASMQNSLEIRSPYLNKKLLLKILEFDMKTLINYGHKYIQKKILKNYLPKKLINNKKIGFILNPKIFIKNSFGKDILNYKNSYKFNRLNLRKMIYKDFFYNEN